MNFNLVNPSVTSAVQTQEVLKKAVVMPQRSQGLFCKASVGTTNQLSQKNKGLLAMDEADYKLDIRLEQNGVAGNKINRDRYREMLVTTKGLSKYITGAIITEETIYQQTTKSSGIIDAFSDNNILVGVKVDPGNAPIHGTNGELWSPGLDNIDERCKNLKNAGVSFLKYRAPVFINKGPSELAVRELAMQQAKYAKTAQAYGLTPVVEPEIIMDGSHGIQKCLEVSQAMWGDIFYYLRQYKVNLEGIICKASMVTPGSTSDEVITPELIAEYTEKLMRTTFPLAVPGIFYMTGGLTDEQATLYLNSIAQLEGNPWNISYSFNRALTDAAMKAWGESKQDDEVAQKVLLNRAEKNTKAVKGILFKQATPELVPV